MRFKLIGLAALASLFVIGITLDAAEVSEAAAALAGEEASVVVASAEVASVVAEGSGGPMFRVRLLESESARGHVRRIPSPALVPAGAATDQAIPATGQAIPVIGQATGGDGEVTDIP